MFHRPSRRRRGRLTLTVVIGVLALADPVGQRPARAVLTVVATDITWPEITLNGDAQVSVTPAPAPWTITDTRLTDAPWTVSISATTPTSAAGSVETTPRTLSVSNLSVTVGPVTADVGADPITNITTTSGLTLSTAPQTLASSIGDNTGIYFFTPTFTFNLPANSYRSNYSGAVGSSSLNDYSSTITVTIA